METPITPECSKADQLPGAVVNGEILPGSRRAFRRSVPVRPVRPLKRGAPADPACGLGCNRARLQRSRAFRAPKSVQRSKISRSGISRPGKRGEDRWSPASAEGPTGRFELSGFLRAQRDGTGSPHPARGRAPSTPLLRQARSVSRFFPGRGSGRPAREPRSLLSSGAPWTFLRRRCRSSSWRRRSRSVALDHVPRGEEDVQGRREDLPDRIRPSGRDRRGSPARYSTSWWRGTGDGSLDALSVQDLVAPAVLRKLDDTVGETPRLGVETTMADASFLGGVGDLPCGARDSSSWEGALYHLYDVKADGDRSSFWRQGSIGLGPRQLGSGAGRRRPIKRGEVARMGAGIKAPVEGATPLRVDDARPASGTPPAGAVNGPWRGSEPPFREGDTKPRAGDTKREECDTPARAGESPADACVSSARAGVTTARAGDTAARAGVSSYRRGVSHEPAGASPVEESCRIASSVASPRRRLCCNWATGVWPDCTLRRLSGGAIVPLGSS